MGQQLIQDDAALRMFFTEEIYLQQEQEPVVIQAPAILPVSVPEISYKFLGKNQRQILILVQDDNEEVSSVEGRELLRNIVKAIQLTANDFALLNYSLCATSRHEELFTYFKPRIVLSFGVSTSMLGLPEKNSNELVFHEQIQMIFSANLHLLAADLNGKKALWGSLKKLEL
ncbi:hypothetical protein N180_11465 [Pedobacter antarcticus 4BY]|uniref:Uncharacterized protein n=2 Tax=Pedobacter antarcticus TaxID=34086 RepID=A0A081PH66_9SPHI|nr:hypothetical protein [Pedobacter antarcticus]KEQ30039.1 hypothetical protein N180_11465 [Pedobacter antarcticus 4BY]SFF48000.1 hypothetical protein SAMN03003324_04117 [Pedobacter antarcticus]